MIYPLAAIALLWFLLSRSGGVPGLHVPFMPRLSAKAGAVAAVLAALLVLVRGNVWVALVFFGFGLWLLGRSERVGRDRPRISRARSPSVEMDYDARSGRMSGRIIAGPHKGALLDGLSRQQCEAILVACRTDDPDGARLLEAYLDRRFPGWRPAEDGDTDPRDRRARPSSRMSEDEAYEILSLRRGATRDEIVRSHRAVMKKWHPDQGGSAALAARANEAKEVLLRRHV